MQFSAKTSIVHFFLTAVCSLSLCTLSAAEKNTEPDYLLEGRKKGLWREVKEAPPTPEIKNKNKVFYVELEKFGIKPGIPQKQEEVIDGETVRCYSDAAYQQALANVKGINAAIAKGAARGAKWIVFPKAEIPICYSSRPNERILINHSNVIVDFGGATLKVIYDSEKRSPFHLTYDKKAKTYVPSTKPVYTFSGKCIVVVDCSNTTVRNVKLIGDKIDRSFKIQAEKAQESTYGIASGGNCTNVVVEKVDVAFFMGDGLTCSSSNTPHVRVGYQMGWKEGNLSPKGKEIPGAGYFRSDFIKVKPESTFYMQGYGYTQGMTDLKKRAYHVYLYDKDKKFLGYVGFVPVLRFFASTKKTAFVRLVVEEEKKDKHSWQMFLKHGKHGENITIRDNYIHHNHRGGMTIGVNDMVITRNNFYNNGVAPDKENNLPGFEQKGGNPFMTRYHINMEDSQGHNIQVINNRFQGGRLGVAVRGNDFIVSDNEFINTGISFYRMFHVICRNNKIRGGGISSFPYNKDGGYFRNWYIENNTISNGSVNFAGNAPITSFCNNHLTGKFNTAGEIQTFKNNTIVVDVNAGFGSAVNLANIRKIDSCKFTKSPDCTVKNTINLNCKDVENCTFERLKISVKDSVIRNSTLENCSLDFTGSFKLENCNLIRSNYTVLNNYATHPHNSAFFILPRKDGALTLDRCKIKMLDLKVPFFSSTNHQPTASTLTLNNTTVEPAGAVKTNLFQQVEGELK